MPRLGRLACGAALFAALLAARARAGVLVVDASGAGDHTTLNAAIAAAAEGDTLLVKPILPSGAYPSATIDGKSLRLVADVPDGTRIGVDDFIRVRNLAAGQQVVLRGFSSSTAVLSNCAGSIWIERCQFSGEHALGGGGFGNCQFALDSPGQLGVEATSCASVTVVRSGAFGGQGNFGFTSGGPSFSPSSRGGSAVRAAATTMALYECTLTGGPGGGGIPVCFVGGGGDGLTAAGSQVLLSDCTVVGGSAGASEPTFFDAGPGVTSDATSSIEVLDSSVAGGSGENGGAYETAPGTVTMLSGVARSFALTSPLREGQAGTLALQGEQGDFVGFLWAFNSGSLPMPARNGWFVLAGPFLTGPFLLGAIASPAGTWNLNITAPHLPPAALTTSFLLQAYFADPGGATLSSGTAFTLLDSSL